MSLVEREISWLLHFRGARKTEDTNSKKKNETELEKDIERESTNEYVNRKNI